MDAIEIVGGTPLSGTVNVSPAKNAVLPLMAATLLADGASKLTTVPKLADVSTLAALLSHLGATVEYGSDGMSVDCSSVTGREAPYDLVKTMRASVLVLGPLVGRFGRARISLPGGCAIGARPIDLHLKGLKLLGADVTLDHGYVEVTASRLTGARIVLDIPTVTGTANLMMAATLADGETVIENSAREPEVVDLADCLNSMGAKVEGAGTAIITVTGVKELAPFVYEPLPDRIEMGTLMVAGALCKGPITIGGGRLDHQDALVEKLRGAGATVEELGSGEVLVSSDGRPQAVDIQTTYYPGFATDMQAQFMALMALAEGSSVVAERIFENRYMHVAELQRMGADIRLDGSTAIVRGVDRLEGARVMATDLRASAALVLAGLAAEGTTVVSRVYHLDRGYEKLEEKLSNLGGNLRRIAEELPGRFKPGE